ncbi:uncharacterized protein V6R79_022326 [Siganus canaliculatus]
MEGLSWQQQSWSGRPPHPRMLRQEPERTEPKPVRKQLLLLKTLRCHGNAATQRLSNTTTQLLSNTTTQLHNYTTTEQHNNTTTTQLHSNTTTQGLSNTTTEQHNYTVTQLHGADEEAQGVKQQQLQNLHEVQGQKLKRTERLQQQLSGQTDSMEEYFSD